MHHWPLNSKFTSNSPSLTLPWLYLHTLEQTHRVTFVLCVIAATGGMTLTSSAKNQGVETLSENYGLREECYCNTAEPELCAICCCSWPSQTTEQQSPGSSLWPLLSLSGLWRMTIAETSTQDSVKYYSYERLTEGRGSVDKVQWSWVWNPSTHRTKQVMWCAPVVLVLGRWRPENPMGSIVSHSSQVSDLQGQSKTSTQ